MVSQVKGKVIGGYYQSCWVDQRTNPGMRVKVKVKVRVKIVRVKIVRVKIGRVKVPWGEEIA